MIFGRSKSKLSPVASTVVLYVTPWCCTRSHGYNIGDKCVALNMPWHWWSQPGIAECERMLSCTTFISHLYGQTVSCWHNILKANNRAYSRLAPSQWKMSLQSNPISHWLGTNLESALKQPLGGLFPLMQCAVLVHHAVIRAGLRAATFPCFEHRPEIGALMYGWW